MLFDGLDKKNNRYMVGYDLGEMASQISFCTLNQNEPETLPIVAGTEEYNIPTVLCKRTEKITEPQQFELLRLGL